MCEYIYIYMLTYLYMSIYSYITIYLYIYIYIWCWWWWWDSCLRPGDRRSHAAASPVEQVHSGKAAGGTGANSGRTQHAKSQTCIRARASCTADERLTGT